MFYTQLYTKFTNISFFRQGIYSKLINKTLKFNYFTLIYLHPENVNLYITVDYPIEYLGLPDFMVNFVDLSFTADCKSVFRTEKIVARV